MKNTYYGCGYKKRICIKALLAVTAALLLFCGCAGEGSKKAESTNGVTGYGDDGTEKKEQIKMSMLKVSENGFIINEEGAEVQLRGVNLGGWLIQETWMCAVKGSECAGDTLSLLEKRGFTKEQINALHDSYINNYIEESDIKKLSKMGLNCIRLPFWYRNFMDEDFEFYTAEHDDNPGFVLVDRLLSWAEKYGMYVILDLHGAPGGQSTDHSCGVIGKNELYTNEEYLAATQRLWETLATRYKDSTTVAAYDILNEPMNNNTDYANGYPAGSEAAVSYTLAAYDRLIKAVRAVDKEHIITVEGVWSTDMLPDPKAYGWVNMMYQLHLYDSTTDMIDYRVNELKSIRTKYKVAVYVGEFNNGDVNQEYAYEKYNNSHISWTMWNYKASKDNLGNWSLFYSAVPEADIENDSYETILKKWGSRLKTASFTLNPTVNGFLKKYA